ncbi:hypothetical protein cypCar_00046528 [Cyprinus carpio]|nr:hypothetical protein cypCar_00046528 [Cyprinus carpio]
MTINLDAPGACRRATQLGLSVQEGVWQPQCKQQSGQKLGPNVWSEPLCCQTPVHLLATPKCISAPYVYAPGTSQSPGAEILPKPRPDKLLAAHGLHVCGRGGQLRRDAAEEKIPAEARVPERASRRAGRLSEQSR